jgi:hypothetical protein
LGGPSGGAPCRGGFPPPTAERRDAYAADSSDSYPSDSRKATFSRPGMM